jgi:putative FmdB family regulatory protein
MPIYEFRCADCNKITSHFTRKVDTEVRPPCQHCGSAQTSRMMSKFGRTYSRADILEKYGDPSSGAGNSADDYRDPRQIGTWVEKRFEEYGVDLPDGAREMIDAAREGVMPGPINDL